MHAIQVEQGGGPEELRYQQVADPRPGPDEVLVEVKAVGVNYMDVYQRRGGYGARPPVIPGAEAAGVVVEVGANAGRLRKGARVAYQGVPGAYAELQAVPAEQVAVLPEGVSFDQAAAVMLQGMTAHYLTHDAFRLEQGHVCLLHAAAGGTGRLIAQMASRKRGARVIGTTSSEEKAEIAREAGVDDVILYTQEDFVEGVRRLTDGRGVHVVYDGVGKATFLKGFETLRPRGMMVLFGAASGPVEPLDLTILASKGSLYLTRPSLRAYAADREERERRARDVLDWVENGELELRIDSTRPLSEAADAHRRLESRESSGKLLLIP